MDVETVADVVFLVEGSAANGAYINELKTNYIVPTLEYFSSGPIEDREYLISERRYSTQYCVVLYRTTANLLEPTCTTFGPFASPQKVLDLFEKLPLVGGGMESCANLAEGFATAHICFDDMKEHRARHSMEVNLNTQKHCILIVNSQPYSMPVIDCWKFSGKTVEQLAGLFNERKINLSIIAPRKIPVLFKIFMKADGDQPLAAKNYAKNIRHLVLLKGYHLKERPQSPNSAASAMANQSNQVGVPNQPQQQQAQGNAQQQQHTGMPMDNTHAPTQQQQQQQNMQQQQVAQMTGMNLNPNQQPGNPLNQQMLQQQQQQQQFANQQNFQGQGNRWVFNPNQQQQPQTRPPFLSGPNVPGGPMVGPMGTVNQGMPGQNPNSALISQLSAPPNQNVNPMMQQQQQQIRMQMLSQQQQQQMQQQLQQQQQQQQNVMNPNMSVTGPGPSSQQVPMANTQQPNTSMANQQNPSSSSDQAVMRDKIWSGTLEWVEKSKPDQQKIPRTLQCTVTANIKDGEPEIKAVNWPSKLLMQLMPKHLVGNIGGQLLKDSKMVVFKPQPCEALDALAKNMTTIFAGCVHFTTPANTPPCDIKVLILLYTAEKNAFLGFIPKNQSMFVERLRKVIQQKQQTAAGGGGHPNSMQQQQQQQQQQNQQQMQNPMGGQISNALTSNNMNPQQQQQQDPNQQQQQHPFNQYNPQQQMNLQMSGGPMNQQMIPMAGGPDQINNPMQQQMSMMQHQRMLAGTGANNPQQQQMPPQQQMQQRMVVRPMMNNNNPGLRHLLQQQSTPGQQFRPQMGGGGPGGVPGMGGGMPNPNQMAGGPGGPNRPYDDSNFDFM